MADPEIVVEKAPPAMDQTGNTTIWWCPAIADVLKPKATELAAGTRITYSFNPDGWGWTGDQTVDKDDRLTIEQELESLGKSTAALTLGYKDSADPKSAAVVLKEGLSGYFVERRNCPNRFKETAGQLVRVISATLGKQIPGPVNGSGKFTYSQKTALTDVVREPVALV